MHHSLFHKLTAIILVTLFLTFSVYAGNGKEYMSEESAAEKASEISEYLDIQRILDFLLSGMISFCKEASSSFIMCIVIILCSTVFSSICDGLKIHENVFSYISVSMLTLFCLIPIQSLIAKAEGYLEALCAFMVSFVPTQAALYAASGFTLTAAISAVSSNIAISVTQVLSASLLLPLIKASCTLISVNAICKRINLSGIISFIRSFSLWVIGLSFTLLTGLMSLQTVLKSSADTLAMKGLRYGAAKLIPVAGGMISESMRTVAASLGFIKNVTGIAGITFIIYLILPPIAAVITIKLFFTILTWLSRATGQEAHSALLDGFNACITVLTSLLLGCSVAFIIILTLFISTTVSL